MQLQVSHGRQAVLHVTKTRDVAPNMLEATNTTVANAEKVRTMKVEMGSPLCEELRVAV